MKTNFFEYFYLKVLKQNGGVINVSAQIINSKILPEEAVTQRCFVKKMFLEI